MTHKCSTESCSTMIADNYTYCYAHYPGRQDKPAEAPPAYKQPSGNKWHDDETIDVLLKINHNLGKIAKALEAREHSEERP